MGKKEERHSQTHTVRICGGAAVVFQPPPECLDIRRKKLALSIRLTHFLTRRQQYTSKRFGLCSQRIRASEKSSGGSESVGHTQTSLPSRRSFALSYCRKNPAIPERGTRAQRGAGTTEAEQKQSAIKVTASGQISAADESLTWGC